VFFGVLEPPFTFEQLLTRKHENLTKAPIAIVKTLKNGGWGVLTPLEHRHQSQETVLVMAFHACRDFTQENVSPPTPQNVKKSSVHPVIHTYARQGRTFVANFF